MLLVGSETEPVALCGIAGSDEVAEMGADVLIFGKLSGEDSVGGDSALARGLGAGFEIGDVDFEDGAEFGHPFGGW